MPRRFGRPNLLLAAAAILATLLVCEALARLWLPPPRFHREPVEFDPELGFRGIPGYRSEVVDEIGSHVVALNAHGLRGREIPDAPAAPGVLRVAFVGDSFLVGQAVREEELATRLVEDGLRSRGRPAEVYNLSGVDWGTAQELLALQRFGPRLAPDLVVLFLYPANDWANNTLALAGRTSVSPGDPIRPYLVPDRGELRLRHLHPVRAFFRTRSRLFATLERRVLARAADAARRIEDPSARLREGRAPREDLELFRVPAPGDPWEQAWETSLALLRAFRDECDALGARLLVVVVPSIHQVVVTPKAIALDVAARAAQRESLGAVLDWNLPERRLGRIFSDEGIEAVLLLGPLRAAARDGARIYSRDEHLAPRGHEIAAAAVVERILGGAAAAGSAADPADATPVRQLPDAAAAPALLDFRTATHADQLGDGWIRWAASEEHGGSWLVGPSALAVVPARAGDLVVRGFVPAGARLPIQGHVGIASLARLRFRIDRPGPFALRFPLEARLTRSWTTSDGYAALVLSPGETFRSAGVRGGLLVQQLGFESPR